jgi:histidinol phosphatase-like enzyme (inositol monophosphatase family)
MPSAELHRCNGMDALGLTERFAALAAWIDEARLASMTWYHQPLEVQTKSDGSPVTQADRAVEHLLREQIHATFGDDAILGEEHGAEPGSSRWRWIIDPIDGTASFMRGIPLWGTLVALEFTEPGEQPRIVAGIADYPALEERIESPSASEAWWIRRAHRIRCHVAPARPLAESVICTTGTEYFRQSNRMSTWQRLGQQCRSLRGWSDCSALLLLCTGRIDGVVEPVMHPWDIGPFAAILPAAGAAWAALGATDGVPGGSLAAASSQGLLSQLLATAQATRSD